MTPDRPDRHDWVLLRSGWAQAVAGPLAPAERTAVEAWDPARRSPNGELPHSGPETGFRPVGGRGTRSGPVHRP
jgi:hypothetical protein